MACVTAGVAASAPASIDVTDLMDEQTTGLFHVRIVGLCALISAAILLAAAATALAKDGGPPKLDIDYACHASQKAVSAPSSATSDVFSACKNDEADARAKLEKNWASYPADDKARCIQPKEYLPTYVEWLTCLEIGRDVKAMRKGQPVPTATTRECPVVRFRDDGTIISVTAC
jgi:hypothetical protein